MEKKENSSEITFCEMREKEIVNVYDGRRLGRVLDLVFDCSTNTVLGIMVPALKKLFSRRGEDIFISLSLIEKIGEDIILVRLEPKNKLDEKKKIKEEKGVYSQYQRELTAD